MSALACLRYNDFDRMFSSEADIFMARLGYPDSGAQQPDTVTTDSRVRSTALTSKNLHNVSDQDATKQLRTDESPAQPGPEMARPRLLADATTQSTDPRREKMAHLEGLLYQRSQ